MKVIDLPLGYLKRAIGKIASLSPVKQRMLLAICRGKKSVRDYSTITGACDPRGHIRDFRQMGIPIEDERVPNPDSGGTHKRYWLDPSLSLDDLIAKFNVNPEI